jgi:hypothetical protein
LKKKIYKKLKKTEDLDSETLVLGPKLTWLKHRFFNDVIIVSWTLEHLMLLDRSLPAPTTTSPWTTVSTHKLLVLNLAFHS